MAEEAVARVTRRVRNLNAESKEEAHSQQAMRQRQKLINQQPQETQEIAGPAREEPTPTSLDIKQLGGPSCTKPLSK